MASWLQRIALERNVDQEMLPERFQSYEEPSWDEYERHRRAAELLVNLPKLFRRALRVLDGVDIDLEKASEAAIARALRKHGMPRLCIRCLEKFSMNNLVDHLVRTTLAKDSHIYSLDKLKDERDLVREKLAEGSEDRHMLKVVCAVKLASLIQLPEWAWSLIGRKIRDEKRRRKRQ